MKLGRSTIYIDIAEIGNYRVKIYMNSVSEAPLGIESREFKFEIPVGQRPMIQDVETILRMVVEEMSR